MRRTPSGSPIGSRSRSCPPAAVLYENDQPASVLPATSRPAVSCREHDGTALPPLAISRIDQRRSRARLRARPGMERHMQRLARPLVALLILLGTAVAPAAADDRSLIVFAAASMKNALDEIDAAFTARSGIKVAPSYAASSMLAKQIEQGAPADIFVSADTDWMEYATAKKSIND